MVSGAVLTGATSSSTAGGGQRKQPPSSNEAAVGNSDGNESYIFDYGDEDETADEEDSDVEVAEVTSDYRHRQQQQPQQHYHVQQRRRQHQSSQHVTDTGVRRSGRTSLVAEENQVPDDDPAQHGSVTSAMSMTGTGNDGSTVISRERWIDRER